MHFSITVAIPADVESGQALYAAVEDALEPFSVDHDVEPYVSVTAAEVSLDKLFQQFWAKLNDDPHNTISYRQAAGDWFGGTADDHGNILSSDNPAARWNWWVIGGRWAGEWVLVDGATRALPPQGSAFGFTAESRDPRRTDAARKGEIEAESICPSYAFIDLQGRWEQQEHTVWPAEPSGRGAARAWAQTYTEWLRSLPADTWLVKVDAHI